MAPLPRVGLLLYVLGGLGILHYLPEVYLMPKARPIYWVVLGLDVLLGAMTISAALGVQRGRPWAPALAMRTAGVVFLTSAGWLILLVPVAVNELRTEPLSKVWNLVPRLLFHAAAVAIWPYALRVLAKNAPPESRKSLGASLVGSLVIGVVVMGMLYLGFM